MCFILRHPFPPDKPTAAVALAAVHRFVPPAVVDAVLHHAGAHVQRHRKLDYSQVIWTLLALNLFTDLDINAVLDQLTHADGFLAPDAPDPTPTASAFVQRRYHLSARPLVALFHQVCQPLATPTTPGAWLFGHRAVALDGTREDVPDTPANAAAFGRPGNDRAAGAFPQVLGVYLVECGTHAILEAGFWPCHTGEAPVARRLLRALTPEMLLLYDRGLHSYDLIATVRAHHAEAIGRLPSTVQPELLQALPDGSVLARLRPPDAPPAERAAGQVVRLITYTLTDPQRQGYGETHRLLTTILDPVVAPALEVVCGYHQRWEIEVTIAEIDTHQRLAGRVLRSHKPVGVMQELYALLLAHYVVRALMAEAAAEAGVAPLELSFVGAVRVVRAFVPDFGKVAVTEWARLYAQMRRKLARKRLPPRRDRANPRAVRRKVSKFPVKRPHQRPPPQPTIPFRQAVQLLI